MERSKLNITVQFHEAYFETRFQYDPRRTIVWKVVTKFIQNKFIPRDARVLDLGCGYCDFINHVAAQERYAVDIFTRIRDYAADGVIARNSSCTNLPFLSDGSLDVVFASNLLEHLTHEELLLTLAEIKRILRPGGRLILMQPNFRYCSRTYFDDYTHLQIFTHMGIYDLLEMTGMRIETMYPRFLPVNMKSTLKLKIPCLAALVRLYLSLPYKPLAGQMLVVAQNETTIQA